MSKKYVRLLELREDDALHSAYNGLVDYSPLIGRIFEVFEDDGYTPWVG